MRDRVAPFYCYPGFNKPNGTDECKRGTRVSVETVRIVEAMQREKR